MHISSHFPALVKKIENFSSFYLRVRYIFLFLNLFIRRIHKSIYSFGYLLGLVEIIKMAGIADPFQTDIRTFCGNILEEGLGLGRIVVGL